jgi:hypothetical protein
MNKDHESPYDRGGADSYYRRGRSPHYYKRIDGKRVLVSRKDMTLKEVAEYDFGFQVNEESGDFKQW